MTRLILHIGMHKTGTTSIQQVLGNSRNKLLKNDVYYPEIKPYNHSTSFPPIFLDDPSKYEIFRQRGIYDKQRAIEEQNKLKELWIKEIQNCTCHNFIVSGEELTLIDESSVRNLKKFTDEHFDDVLIIMYARNPNSFFPSVLSEYVKHGGENIVHQNYSRTFPLYSFRLQKYINVYGSDKVKVRPFDRKNFKNGDLFEDFFQTCGIKLDVKDLNHSIANESLDESAVMFLLEYNRRFPRYLNGVINESRGLPYRLHVFYNVINKINKKKFSIEMKFNEDDTNEVNNEIEYINNHLKSEEHFQKVSVSDEPIRLPDSDKISIDFYIELVNEYNKELDRLLTKIDGFVSLEQRNNFKINNLQSENKALKNILRKYNHSTEFYPDLTINNDNLLVDQESIFNLYNSHGHSKIKKIKNLLLYFKYKNKNLKFFDNDYYKKIYLETGPSQITPLKHYFLYGAYEGKNPCKEFTTKEYIRDNPEIVLTGEIPLVHLYEKDQRHS
ncbi:hypothetical protein [Marinicrinis sediminis]|uniref:Sulfotransferase domain-containing protein n=1 Tax=Marinicrinis sediminis TaxID=1652465 RepID=A0ABW5RAI6_9BACL